MATGPIHMWARVGVGSAERAEGRSAGRSQSREARPAERRAAGCLDEVEKPVTTLAKTDLGAGYASVVVWTLGR
jgi:hypothetical protein